MYIGNRDQFLVKSGRQKENKRTRNEITNG